MKKLLVAFLLLTSSAFAQTTAYRAGPGVQMTTSASRPTTIAGRRTVWPDSSNRLRYWNGTADLQVAAIAAATKGDLAVWNGSAWELLAAGANGLCLKTDSTESSGLEWGSCGGGGGSTGNWTFSGDAADLSGAGTMTLGATTATAIALGRATANVTMAGSAPATTGWTWDATTNSEYVLNNGVGATIAEGSALLNNETASSGNQKWSPSLVLQGRGWKTDATAASRAVAYALTTVPIQGTANPTGELRISESINGGAYSTIAQFGSSTITFSKALSLPSHGVTLGGNLAFAADESANVGASGTEAATVYTRTVSVGSGNLNLATDAASTSVVIDPAGGADELTVSTTAITAAVPIAASFTTTTIAPSWSNVTYSNSWVDFGAPYPSTATYKDALGRCHLRLAVKNGTSSTAITTLPAGCRPGHQLIVPVVDSVGAVTTSMTITTAGVVTPISAGTSGWFAFISFAAEN